MAPSRSRSPTCPTRSRPPRPRPPTTIGKENNSAEITLKAANDAKTVDNQAIKVTTSGGGASKDVSFKLSVKAKS
jgi:hypothetical protein